MQLYSECLYCMFDHHWSLVKDHQDEARKAAFMREVCRVLADADPSLASPVPTAKLQKLYAARFPERDNYAELKRRYNDMMLSRLPELREKLRGAPDPFKLAVWMAMAGNYIDFGILKEIDDARLANMLLTPDEKAVGTPVLDELRADVRSARHLVYACDNCGEVVLDMLLMEEIKRENPALTITALVRGENVLNDVTAEDARAVGLDRVAKIVGNGSNIGGTQLELLGEEAREAMQTADVVISKGQGNFETLTGAGLNIYYLFLAKCPHYTKWFGMEHMAGQLLHARPTC